MSDLLLGLREALRVLNAGLLGSTAYYRNDWEQGLDTGIENCREAIAQRISYLERKAAADAAGETRYRVATFVRPWPGHPEGVHVIQYVMNDEILSTDVCATTLDAVRARCHREAKLENRDLFEDVGGLIKVIHPERQ